ncbi:MAG: hypothetical protein IT338_13340 [Thermomicrobiales bacterium]|nr:hypothetical protein [Thermomicrobiales bacterium]
MAGIGTRLIATAGLVAVLALPLSGLTNAAAQETEHGFPAQLHSGTCADLGAVVHPLGAVHRGVIADVTHGADEVGNAVKAVAQKSEELVGKAFDEIRKVDQEIRREHPAVLPVEMSETTVNVTLADLLASPHAVDVAQSTSHMEASIACGDITGQMPEQGRDLAVPMHARNNSGYSGVAWLHQDGDKTTVLLFLTQGLTETAGTPVASTPAP